MVLYANEVRTIPEVQSSKVLSYVVVQLQRTVSFTKIKRLSILRVVVLYSTEVLSYYRTKVLSQVQYLASYHKYLRRYCITTRTTRKIHTVREHTVGPTISHYFRERMPLS